MTLTKVQLQLKQTNAIGIDQNTNISAILNHTCGNDYIAIRQNTAAWGAYHSIFEQWVYTALGDSDSHFIFWIYNSLG
ncbi:MAG: hypothetical protein KGS46_17935 [Chloroflexi bacterium]|jgi:hypothetical protein|nr:hypothetical protein [Chloroflexota bacterium]